MKPKRTQEAKRNAQSAKPKSASKNARTGASSQTNETIFSAEDLDSIQHTISSIRSDGTNVCESGWLSPLQSSPVKRSQRVQVQSSESLLHSSELSIAREGVPSSSTTAISTTLSSSSSSSTSSSYAKILYQQKLAKYKALLSDSFGSPTTSTMNSSRASQSISGAPTGLGNPNLRFPLFESPDKENQNYTEMFNQSVDASKTLLSTKHHREGGEGGNQQYCHEEDNEGIVLPMHLIDKLRIAEHEYELQLAKQRKQAISRLKDMLARGSQAHLSEARQQCEQDWSRRKKALLQAIEQYTKHLCRTLLSENTTEETAIPAALLSNIPKEVQDALHDLVLDMKRQRQNQLALEMREHVLTASHGVAHSQHEAHKSTQAAQHTQQVLRVFHDLVQTIRASSVRATLAKDAGSLPSCSSVVRGLQVERYALVKAIEKASWQQLRLHRVFTQQAEDLRERMQAVRNPH